MAPFTKPKDGKNYNSGAGSGSKNTSVNTSSKSSKLTTAPKGSGNKPTVVSTKVNKAYAATSSAPKSPSSSSGSKNFLTPTSKSDKSKDKSSFGLIWIPTKRHNKKKDLVYNPHRNDRRRDRSPSMYRFLDTTEKKGDDTTASTQLVHLVSKELPPEVPLKEDDHKDVSSDEGEDDNCTKVAKCFFCCMDTLDCTIM